MSRRLGNFELIDEIGSGAWGRVCRARQVTLGGRTVALKELWPQLAADARTRQRFLDEANNMARLSHPHIVKVIDVGVQDGTYYFAMEYIRGQSLAELAAQGEPMTPGRVAHIGIQVAEALGHAHRNAVIHRDIKPANIMLDQDGRVAVTDFGIAKVGEGSGLTATGAAIGTPEYMSPEQAQGRPVDGRSDLYSLGVVLYHLVTGYVPFSGTTPVAVGMRHVAEPPRDPRRTRPDCPEWLAASIMRALAKNPEDRFGSGEEMAAALRAAGSPRAFAAPTPTQPQAALTSYGQVAPPGTLPPVSVPPARAKGRPRRTCLVALLLLAIAALIGLIAIAAWLHRNSRRPVAPPQPPPAPIHGGGSTGGGGKAAIDGGGPTTETSESGKREAVVSEPQVSVPDVVGLSATDAETLLKKAGSFPAVYNDPRHSAHYPKDAIASQHPRAGARQQRGDAVYLAKSLGPPPPPPQPENAEAEVIATITRLDRAVTNGDLRATVACFTTDSDCRPEAADFRDGGGYEGIERWETVDFRGLRRSGDTAAIRCTLIEYTPGGAFAMPMEYGLRRVGGRWLIHTLDQVEPTESAEAEFGSDDYGARDGDPPRHGPKSSEDDVLRYWNQVLSDLVPADGSS